MKNSSTIVLLIASFAFGRYSVPQSTKTEVKTDKKVEKRVDKKQDVNTRKRKNTTTTEITRPDGTKEKVTKIVEDSHTKKKTDTTKLQNSEKVSSSISETVRSGSRLTVSALVGTKVTFSEPLTPVYGGMISKEILGPISIGAFGFNSGLAGMAVGLTF